LPRAAAGLRSNF